MAQRRVVVTGVGAVTPLGPSASAFWDGLLAGRTGIGLVRRFDASEYDVRFGGECNDFDPKAFIDHRLTKRMDRFSQFGYAAAIMAFEEAGLRDAEFDSTRAGVILGTGIGGISELEEQYKRLLFKGPGRVSAFTIPKLMSNAGSGHVSIELKLQAISTAVSTACASAGNAMGDALNAIRGNAIGNSSSG